MFYRYPIHVSNELDKTIVVLKGSARNGFYLKKEMNLDVGI